MTDEELNRAIWEDGKAAPVLTKDMFSKAVAQMKERLSMRPKDPEKVVWYAGEHGLKQVGIPIPPRTAESPTGRLFEITHLGVRELFEVP